MVPPSWSAVTSQTVMASPAAARAGIRAQRHAVHPAVVAADDADYLSAGGIPDADAILAEAAPRGRATGCPG